MASSRSFFARFGRAALVGSPGVAILPFVFPLPPGIPVIAVLVNPAVLLMLAALVGASAAPKAGFRSTLILGSRSEPRALVGCLAGGMAMGFAVALVDHAAAPFWRTGDLPTLREGRDAAALALGLLYGGMTEEVLLRWGLMSAMALGLMRILPRPAASWSAAGLAAIVFAFAHLPALFIEAGALTPALTVRTLVWNGLLGLAFGAAILRHGLEAAILAHMGVHLGFAVAAA